jgi:hypothetical protein
MSETVQATDDSPSERERALQLSDPRVQQEFAAFLRHWLSARGHDLRSDNIQRAVRLFVASTDDRLADEKREDQQP